MPGGERVLDFADEPARLSVSVDRLLVRRDGRDDVSIPLGEAAVAVVAHPRLSITGAALAGLMRHGGSVVVCDDACTPVGMLLPLGVNYEQTRRVLAQATASRPTNKRLWRSIVRAKVRAQAYTLELHRGDDAGLRALSKEVKSGDTTNVEGRAAQRYWVRLFGPEFRRRRAADDQNRLLNYGYAVLRAAVGRAVCAAGLHPSLGVHHTGRGNAYCLADDLMEPYRAMVDDEVAEIVAERGDDVALDKAIKARLIGVLHARIEGAGESRTVLDWVGRTANSLAQVYAGEGQDVSYPEGLWKEGPKGASADRR